MRKIIILFLIVSYQVVFFDFLVASNSNSNSEITLKKDAIGGIIRIPSQNPVSFNAYLSDAILSIQAVNYSSSVQIEITGATVLNHCFNFETSDTALIDLKLLPDGV